MIGWEWSELEQDQTHHFCYSDIRNQQTLITESVLLFLSAIICLLAVKKYCVIWRSISNRNQNANLAYLGILIWWFSIYAPISGYIAKDLYGIVVYIIYAGRTGVDNQLSWFSKFYFALDWGNAFVLQTVLIFVPYHW